MSSQSQSSSSSSSSLSASVSSLRSSLSLLDSSIAILDTGISDFPRLKKVLTSTRVRDPIVSPSPSFSGHVLPPLLPFFSDPSSQPLTNTPRAPQHFELTPSSTLIAAQSSLASELAPAITTLLARAETHIAKLERKQAALVARSELLEGRLEGAAAPKHASGQKPTGEGGGGRGGEEKARRLKALRGKRERLGYAVERLQLQAQQRQRQLRMSVAAT